MDKVIIVGGGASGLVAGIFAARAGKAVTILEQKDRVGKKILATGNGRCNYTNSHMELSCFNSENIDFVEKALDRFSYQETINFFMNLGIYPKDIKGYTYPYSLQALSVVHVLELEALYLEVNIICNISVKQIKKSNDIFLVETDKKNYKANKVILANGGCASPNLGSDGSGYALAKKLGHKIIEPLPGLVQLVSDEKFTKMIAGIRTDALINVYIDDELVSYQRGELQFTKYGVSGIVTLQISRFASKALNSSKKVMLNIDLFPDMEWQDIIDLIENRINNNPYKNMEEIFYGLFNNKLVLALLKRTNISKDMKCNKLDKANLIKLVDMIKNFNMNIVDTKDFSMAQVTVGGVDTSSVNPDTMESKIVKGLYFCGEILDVDGTCGGYNLQWAWTSGYIAGKSV